MAAYIYIIKNNINKKVYIGKTTQEPIVRFKCHIRDAVKYNKDTKLCRAIRKYGFKNFYLEILLECKKSDLNENEIRQIKKFESVSKGYNIKKGGEGGKHSEETKKKIAEANKKRKWTPEMRKAMSEAIKNSPKCRGRKHSEETKKKIAEANKKRKITKQMRKNMTQAQTKLNGKPIVCLETKEKFVSIKEACRKMNLNDGHLRGHLKGKYPHIKGYSFRYITDGY